MTTRRTVCLIMVAYVAAACAADTASDACKMCFHATLREVARTAWTTLETAVRGFLLGFGAAILKDLLIDRKASADAVSDFQATLKFARVVGLGMSSFMVGIAIFLPARLRSDYLSNTPPSRGFS